MIFWFTYFENITIQVKATVVTFWVIVERIWATFHICIWSHWPRYLPSNTIRRHLLSGPSSDPDEQDSTQQLHQSFPSQPLCRGSSGSGHLHPDHPRRNHNQKGRLDSGQGKIVYRWAWPCCSGYGWQLMFERSWVWILVPYTGWTFGHFFTLIFCKNGIVCLERPKIKEKEAGVGPFVKRLSNDWVQLKKLENSSRFLWFL